MNNNENREENYLALIDRETGLYGRILTKVVRTEVKILP